MEEAVNKKADESKKKKRTEKYLGRRHSGYRLFPSPDEVAGTDYGIYYLLHPQPLRQSAAADRDRPVEKRIDRY